MFITIEGPEGSGKSACARWLAERLSARGIAVTETREPGGTALGERVRGFVLDPVQPPLPRTSLFLFSAARAELVGRVIQPALAADRLVICDRYTDSTLAYQGFGDGMPLEDVRAAVRLASGGLSPDLTLLLDVPVEVGLRRRAGAGDWNAFDARDLVFHERVRRGFLSLASDEPIRFRVIDASMSLNQVRSAVLAALPAQLRENVEAAASVDLDWRIVGGAQDEDAVLHSAE
jgi:dTMP kinase